MPADPSDPWPPDSEGSRIDHGLSAVEVEQRQAAGRTNRSERRTSRSFADIVRANVFTRFNAIITALAVVVLVFGSPIDALFAGVMVVNAAIGVIQEVRAKRSLDRLTLLIAPRVLVVRDGGEHEVDPGELVIDDVVRLRAGDEVPVDGTVLRSEGMEVNESALTGEADAIVKSDGDEVLSGSAVVAGGGLIVATRVGDERWIETLVAEARQFVVTRSELRVGVDQILKVISWIIVPLGAIAVWGQLRTDQDFDDAMVSSVAAVVGLVPQGLVLLVSMAMAVATLRLGKQQVVVQELHAVEGLARIDVLCVDKTGTLTTGEFELDDLVALDVEPDRFREGLAALVASERSPTASSQVIAGALAAPDGWTMVGQVPFSSARKWSCSSFESHGTWAMGAPEVLFDAVGTPADSEHRARVSALTAEARRVLLVARSDAAIGAGDQLPAGLTVAGLVVLVEQLRPDAGDIMRYFADQHVAVKIISGDSSETVSAVAQRLGIAGGEHRVDLRHVDDGEYDSVVDESVVFGRVRPEQKRELVDALQRSGHTVAMTGDGVNDIPALKRSDIGIAMNTATPATKSIAQLVLVDGRFDRLPSVVAEGRRVVANMERVSTLFITKTVYSVMFVLAIGFSGSVFPFLPRHISLVSELTIGVPAFLLSFRAADRPARPGYLRRVLEFAIPAGLLVSAIVLATYWLARSPVVDATLSQARSVATISLAATALWVLYRIMRPLDRFDAVLLGLLVAALSLVAVTDIGQEFYALDWPAGQDLLVLVSVTVSSIAVFELALVLLRRWGMVLMEPAEARSIDA